MAINVNVREEIMQALKDAEDPKDRAFLAILMRFADHVERLFADDEMLRRKVLNGDYELHSKDHDYVNQLRSLNAIAAIEFVNSRIAGGGVCQYVKKKIAEEEEARKDLHGYWRKFIETLIGQAPTALLYGVMFLAGYKVLS